MRRHADANYEVATPEEAEAISAIGVDHIGVLVGDGAFPRELPVRKASAVMKMIRPPSVLSALFLSGRPSYRTDGTGA